MVPLRLRLLHPLSKSGKTYGTPQIPAREHSDRARRQSSRCTSTWYITRRSIPNDRAKQIDSGPFLDGYQALAVRWGAYQRNHGGSSSSRHDELECFPSATARGRVDLLGGDLSMSRIPLERYILYTNGRDLKRSVMCLSSANRSGDEIGVCTWGYGIGSRVRSWLSISGCRS